MADVAIIGGGPAGLSAALFTAKNGLETVVFDDDETWLHSAHLFNYLGIESVDGTAFVEQARQHAIDHGADLREERVEAVGRSDGGFVLETEQGDYDADYVVFATGSDRDLAEDLGCATTGEGPVEVNLDMETSVDGAYAAGAVVRESKFQAVISAGDGAVAALDILEAEVSEGFHDFDTPEDAE